MFPTSSKQSSLPTEITKAPTSPEQSPSLQQQRQSASPHHPAATSSSNSSIDEDERFLQQCAGLPSLDPHLFGPQRWLEQTLGELIFAPGQRVAVACPLPASTTTTAPPRKAAALPEGYTGRLGRYLNGRVVLTVGGLESLVELIPTASHESSPYSSTTAAASTSLTTNSGSAEGIKQAGAPPLLTSKREFIKLAQLSLRGPLGAERAWMDWDAPATSSHSVHRVLAEGRHLLSLPLLQFIEVGQLLEYHSSLDDPLELTVVRIKANFAGLLQLEPIGGEECNSGGDSDREEGEAPTHFFFDHITSWRCHPLGWFRRQPASFGYKLINNSSGGEPAPAWLFHYRPLRPHHMAAGALVEVLEPASRAAIMPGWVRSCVNPHFYRVEVLQSAVLQGGDESGHAGPAGATANEELLCHAGCEHILPVGFAARNQLRLTTPSLISNPTEHGGGNEPFSYSQLRRALKKQLAAGSSHRGAHNAPTSPPIHICAAPDSAFSDLFSPPGVHHSGGGGDREGDVGGGGIAAISPSLPWGGKGGGPGSGEPPRRVLKGRWVKLQHSRHPMVFYPALVVRSSRCGLLWLHSDYYEGDIGGGGGHGRRFTGPTIHSIRSPRIYRWDYPMKAGLVTIYPTPLAASTTNLGAPPNSTASQHPASSSSSLTFPLQHLSRFDLSSSFTCQRTPLFRVGDHKKKFLSATWFKASDTLWLPSVYVNPDCFVGPFLNSTKLRQLTVGKRYGPGPLPLVVDSLLRDLLLAGNRLAQVVELLQAGDKHHPAPKLHLKLRPASFHLLGGGGRGGGAANTRRLRMAVEVCESTAEFPGWIRALLAQLDACPGLVSLEKPAPSAKESRRQQVAAGSATPVGGVAAGDGTTVTSRCRWNCAGVISGGGGGGNDPGAGVWLQPERHINTAPPLSSQQQQKMLALQASARREQKGYYLRASKAKKMRIAEEEVEVGSEWAPTAPLGAGAGKLQQPQQLAEPNRAGMMAAGLEKKKNNNYGDSSSGEDDDETTTSTTTTSSPSSSSEQEDDERDGEEVEETVGEASHAHYHPYSTAPSQPPGPMWSPELAPMLAASTSSSTPPPLLVHAAHHMASPPVLGNPRRWSRKELAEWLHAGGTSTEVVARLYDEEVDGEAAVMFDQEALKKLGLKLGPELKLRSLIERLQVTAASMAE